MGCQAIAMSPPPPSLWTDRQNSGQKVLIEEHTWSYWWGGFNAWTTPLSHSQWVPGLIGIYIPTTALFCNCYSKVHQLVYLS